MVCMKLQTDSKLYFPTHADAFIEGSREKWELSKNTGGDAQRQTDYVFFCVYENCTLVKFLRFLKIWFNPGSEFAGETFRKNGSSHTSKTNTQARETCRQY